MQSSAAMLIYTNSTPSDSLRKIIEKMLVDDISHVVKNDELILRFGNRLCIKLRKDGNQ